MSVSMVNVAVLAKLQEGSEIPANYAAFLFPSHLVWLARRRYDAGEYDECIRLARSALQSTARLSPTGSIEACRYLCLAAARRGKQDDFQHGIAILRRASNDSWARSNINFLLGFNARLAGNAPEAETFMREAYRESPGNFQAARELAAICISRGDLVSAEQFARRAYEIAPDNPYIIDILLSVLVKSRKDKSRDSENEIPVLFEKLKDVGEEEGHSFYTTRRAGYELEARNIEEARRLIDEAIKKTPNIFNVRKLRAEIYLEKGNVAVALEEITKLRSLVFKESGSDKLTNLRPLLELEASYYAAIKDFRAARDLYRRKGVFTEEESKAAIKALDYQEAFSKR